MGQTIKPTTVQAMRRFLDLLEISAPVYASSEEVLSLLIAKMKEKRQDADTQASLKAFMQELERDSSDYGEELPCPECETINPQEVVDGLSALLFAPGSSESGACSSRLLISACAVMFIVAGSFLYFREGEKGRTEEEIQACSEEVGSRQFFTLVDEATTHLSNLDPLPLMNQFNQLSLQDQKAEISALCKMNPSEIAEHINSRFHASVKPRSWQDWLNQIKEDQEYSLGVEYKGVAF